MIDDQAHQAILDAARVVGNELQPIIQRHLLAAAEVMPPSDMVLMLMHVVSGTMRGALAFSLQYRRDDVDAGELFDQTLEHLIKLTALSRPRTVAIADALRMESDAN